VKSAGKVGWVDALAVDIRVKSAGNFSARKKMSKTFRHALLLVFEYKCQSGMASPGPLLSMHTDLQLAYQLATEKFQIPRQHITVITDVVPPPASGRPWDPLRATGENPKIIQLAYPDIAIIVREIAQFIENTIRGVADTVRKGSEVTNEVFIYISGHGAQIPTIGADELLNEEDNALILMTYTETGHERRYLRSGDIFRLFFGQIPVTESGAMMVPITRRVSVPDMRINPTYCFEDDESCHVQLTPGGIPGSPRINYVTDRGLPITTSMLVVFDTCHSGTMSDFHYVYRPEQRMMCASNSLPGGIRYPYCVSIAATEDSRDAPSTSNGSPFTRHLYAVMQEILQPITIRDFHTLLHRQLPRLLASCSPTICATVCDATRTLPFFSV
jgi:hypothetical protein